MHIVHGELRKDPFIKSGVGQDGQSTMFAFELSEVIKNKQTGENEYTNYNAVIFAKSPAQISYYQTAIVKGNFVVVNAEKLKINKSDCGQYIKLDMENARLEGAKYIEATQQGGFQQQPQQGGFQQQPQPPQNQQGGFNQPQQGGKAHLYK